ncbi:MAG: type II toxin-antitoxin system VapC family toxin [Mobilicoccus sp.]|nr:type II toxin-antitoxin system VapC family toxin [Mobilicoccus sp.]
MLLLDVNVLIAAFHGDHPHHSTVRAWFDELLVRAADFGVPSTAWSSFLRIVTNRRIFTAPASRDDAFAFIDAVIAQPGHVPIEPGTRHLTLLQQVCDAADATGDLVPDATLAAIALEHGAVVATLDRDFARFEKVPTTRPGT